MQKKAKLLGGRKVMLCNVKSALSYINWIINITTNSYTTVNIKSTYNYSLLVDAIEKLLK
jgi:hypothetical protein